jgi:hypothetical protein
MMAGNRRGSWLTKRGWGACLGALLLACGSSEDGGAAFAPVGDDVEREGWVDTAHPLAGDGATSFESFPRASTGGEYTERWDPYFIEMLGFDAGPLTSVVGDHLLSLSRYRGLVSTRLTGPDAPAVESSVPLGGLPVGLVVSDGVAAVIVVDPQRPGCVLGDCIPRQTSRVVLVEVDDPASPRALGEQRFDGTVLAARQVGGVLHVLSQDVELCSICEVIPRSNLAWLSFDRSAPRELPPPRVAAWGKDAFFGGERLFMLAEGATFDETVLRVAELSQPEPALSAPITLAGRVRQARASDDRLRVSYDRGLLDIETFALGSGAPVSLGRGTLAPPDGESFSWLTFDGDRAVTTLDISRRHAVLDLSDPSAPRLAALLDLGLSQSDLAVANDRVLAVGRSTLPADAAPEDVTAYGPVGVVLVDIADLAAPRILDRATLGSFQAEHRGAPMLRDGRAFFTFYDPFLGSGTLADACGRTNGSLIGYDITAETLGAPVALGGIDDEVQIEAVGDDWWAASSVSVMRYVPNSPAPSARAELTRWVDRLQPLSGGLALFGVDFATNAPTFELAPARDTPAPLDVSSAVGLSRIGCDERRHWFSPIAERDGNLFALRFHLPPEPDAASAVTLHVVAPGSTGLSSPRSLELEPLAAGEAYLGAVQTDRALLVARRGASADSRAASGLEWRYPGSASEPVLGYATRYDSPWDNHFGDSPGLGANVSYEVVDLSDPTAPVRASRLDVEPALADGLFGFVRGLTRDGAGGFLVDGSIDGPSVVSGSVLAGYHSEPTSGGWVRFYLDRFDFSDPRAPVALAPIPIPGSVLDFDAATGGLITLEALPFRDPVESPECLGDPRLRDGVECPGQARALNGLVVDGERATRVGRLLLDTDEREALRFAVSNGTVYYVTQPLGLTSDRLGPFAARDIALQRVRLRDGRFERLPSFDIAGSSNLSPKLWTQFAARGDRALWVTGGQLMVADFRSGQPRLEVHDIGPWGCAELELRDDTAYCAQGRAGYVAVTLGQP